MHIHEVIVDGFKSYATKTVISGFDPHFNAITGLNGTGKSNILDSICFVMGISNLSQVRVGNLQELVYKQGQAGVTKATVTIVFDNSDVATSPVGYESHTQIHVTRQIAIGGKNKYMINGHTVQQQQVQNFFHSVQLNVNNPHFLIMQGRITKVLNMKPPEILSMIEEAAGTRMFETKKQAALSTIAKKQAKVEELTKVMEADILPTLEKLRSERQCYAAWTSNNSDIEILTRLLTAYDYVDALAKVESSESDRLAMVRQLEDFQEEEETCNAAIKTADSKIAGILNNRNGTLETSLAQKKKTADDLSKDLVKIDTLWKNRQETLKSERDQSAALNKQIGASGESITAKDTELQLINKQVISKESELAEAEQKMGEMREKFQKALAGVADESTAETLSLPEQVRTWEAVERDAVSQIQQISLKSEHVKAALKNAAKETKADQTKYNSLVTEAEKLRRNVASIEAEIQSLGVIDSKEHISQQTIDTSAAKISSLNDKMNSMNAYLKAALSFDYKDPERNFDRSRVRGLIAQLINVKDPRNAVALEMAAGGKLMNVVVDNEVTGKLLLEKGQMTTRRTILPLNKISSKVIDGARIQLAKDVARQAGGSAFSALELIDFEESSRRAIEYVFGNVIICDNAITAKAVTFHKNILVRTVTLDGDVYEPGGTMSGGSKGELGRLLATLCEKTTIFNTLTTLRAEFAQMQKSFQLFETNASKSKDLFNNLDLAKQALCVCESKMSATSYAQSVQAVETMENEIKEFAKETSILQAKCEKAKEELKKLKNAEKNIQKQRETAMKEMEKVVKESQKTVNSLKSEVVALKHKRDLLAGELDGFKKDIDSAKEQICSLEVSIKKLETEVQSLSIQTDDMRAQYDLANKEVQNLNAELQRCDKEIKALEKEKDALSKQIQNASLEARKLQHKLKQWEKDCKDAGKVVTLMLKQYPWIETQKSLFGVAGGDFDFKAAGDMGKIRQKLQSLKSEQERLSKKINKKVIGMIEKAESEASELNRKKEVILIDKTKIEEVISELDVKKQQALQTTWMKVNRDFGSIFSTLLPGTTAKLDPLEGCTVADGLEVKVAFNGVWKESLTELSGGQRSLLALSLILSLLLFKPAPMYILDEVDAALDLSHTQNIGLMLRTHFSTSQFIVVSLKEGMFNNANVIFRTRFVDGISSVSRTVVGSRGAAATIQNGSDENADVVPASKKSKASGKSARRTVDEEGLII